jgi:hypothetical protein
LYWGNRIFVILSGTAQQKRLRKEIATAAHLKGLLKADDFAASIKAMP